jgi:hypothetical protein
MLPGIKSVGFFPSTLTLSFVGYTRSETTSLNWASMASGGPIAAGDLGIYIDGSLGSSIPSSVIPSGFTNIFDQSHDTGAAVKLMVSYKILTGSEGTVAGMVDVPDESKIGLVFRPSKPISTVTRSTVTSFEFTGGNPSAQTIDPTTEFNPTIVLGMVKSYGAIAASFSTFSPTADTQAPSAASSPLMVVGFKLYNNSPQSHTIDANDLGTTLLSSMYLRIE